MYSQSDVLFVHSHHVGRLHFETALEMVFTVRVKLMHAYYRCVTAYAGYVGSESLNHLWPTVSCYHEAGQKCNATVQPVRLICGFIGNLLAIVFMFVVLEPMNYRQRRGTGLESGLKDLPLQK